MAKNKKTISLRDKLIDSIIKSKYSDDDPKYYQSNENFLNTLTIAELQAMCEEDFDDDDDDDLEEMPRSFVDTDEDTNQYEEWIDPLDAEYLPREDDRDYYHALN